MREVHPQRPGRGALDPGGEGAVAHEVAAAGPVEPRAGLGLLDEPGLLQAAHGLGDRVVRGRRGCDEGGEIVREVIHRVHPPRRVRRDRGGCGIGGVRARRAAGPAPAGSVLLVEAGTGGSGDGRRRPRSTPPRRATPATGRTRPSWRPGIPAVVPRGRGVGGSGAINAAVWTYVTPADAAGWDLPGWRYPTLRYWYADRRTGGAVRLGRADPGAGALGRAAAPRARSGSSPPRRRWASRPSRTRTRAARPARG